MSLDTLNVVIFVVIAVYLGTIVALMLYLERAHHALWQSFGGSDPTVTNSRIESWRFVRTGLFAVFQGRNPAISDARVAVLVVAIRVLFLAALALIAVQLHMKGRF